MSRFVTTARQTPTYREAVAALNKLVKEGGLDDAQRAAGEAVADVMMKAQKRCVDRGKPDLKFSAAHPCVARLVRKRCPAFPWPNRVDYMPCRPPGADHDFLMLDEGRPHSFVTHPYSLDTEVLQQMVTFAETWGLEFAIDGFSWHFPGRTVRVIWRKASEKGIPTHRDVVAKES